VVREEFEVVQAPSPQPLVSDLASSFNIALRAEDLVPETAFAVQLEELDGTLIERYPTEGFAEIPLQVTGSVRVVVVPVRYAADESMRLPETSPERMAELREALAARLPTTEVQLSVRDIIDYDEPVQIRQDWADLLVALQGLRDSDGAADNVYYYALVSPANSADAYYAACPTGQRCPSGRALIVRDNWPARYRVAAGLGFGGTRTKETFIHEMGHSHGLHHSPCGLSSTPGPDAPEFPHHAARLGSPGYDRIEGRVLADPVRRDFMSYCDPTWVSDFAWNLLADRITLVEGGGISPAEAVVQPLGTIRELSVE
jgi:hypothetical protein